MSIFLFIIGIIVAAMWLNAFLNNSGGETLQALVVLTLVIILIFYVLIGGCIPVASSDSNILVKAYKVDDERVVFVLPNNQTQVYTDAKTVTHTEHGQDVKFIERGRYNVYGGKVATEYIINQ